MFIGFESVDVDADGVRIRARVGGSGPPVLLLHGYPQTSAMWHRVAPGLAERHTVVVPDLRGYGHSAKPPSGPDHAAYGKRAMAADQAAVMRALGHDRYVVVGHDRGARVAHRMCLDQADAVTRAAVLDIVPTRHVLGHADLALARTYEHWFFLGQESELPEVLLRASGAEYLRGKLRQWSATPDAAAFDRVFAAEPLAEYLACFADPETVRGSTEDYRAGLTDDLADDDADFAAGRRVTCPLLVLWGESGFVGQRYDVLRVWRGHAARADLVTGRGLPGGHFVPEEAPEETLAALLEFLDG